MKALFAKIFGNFIGTVIGLYFMAAFLVFTPYYNWNYAQIHGFMKWVLFGEVVATAKAIAWPYFVFFSSSGGSASHVSKAIDYKNTGSGLHISIFISRASLFVVSVFIKYSKWLGVFYLFAIMQS